MGNEDMLSSVLVALTQQVRALVAELKQLNELLGEDDDSPVSG